MKKDSKIYKGKKERVKSISLKDKKESSDDKTLTFRSDDEEYAMVVRNFKNSLKGRVDLLDNHEWIRSDYVKRMIRKARMIENALDTVIRVISLVNVQSLHTTRKKEFVWGSWSDSGNEAEDNINEETCLLAQSSNEVTLESSHFSDNASSLMTIICKLSIIGETKHIGFVGSTAVLARDKSTIKAENGSTVPGSIDPSTSQKVAEQVFSPPISSRSDFVIVRKKLIDKNIKILERPPLKLSLRNGLGFLKIESRSKTPPPRRNDYSQPRYNTP
nr:hypothetical protein [Tanacetum cinerariifolium]